MRLSRAAFLFFVAVMPVVAAAAFYMISQDVTPGMLLSQSYTLCGDGLTQSTRGEECDDGNRASNDGCSLSCTREFCGDGVMQSGEQCDNGSVCRKDGHPQATGIPVVGIACRTDSQCRVCGIVPGTSVHRCGGDPAGALCTMDSDCVYAPFSCNYNGARDASCTDACKRIATSSSSAARSSIRSSSSRSSSRSSQGSHTQQQTYCPQGTACTRRTDCISTGRTCTSFVSNVCGVATTCCCDMLGTYQEPSSSSAAAVTNIMNAPVTTASKSSSSNPGSDFAAAQASSAFSSAAHAAARASSSKAAAQASIAAESSASSRVSSASSRIVRSSSSRAPGIVINRPPQTFRPIGQTLSSMSASSSGEASSKTVSTYCGDGIVDPQVEFCDDGNLESGDGCNAQCGIEPRGPDTITETVPTVIGELPSQMQRPQSSAQGIGDDSFGGQGSAAGRTHSLVGLIGLVVILLMVGGIGAGFWWIRRMK